MRNKYLLLLVSLLLSLLIAELALRYVFKIVPGFHISSQWFTPVNTLYNLRGYHADSNGIFRVDDEVAEYLHKRLTVSGYSVDTLSNVSWEVFGTDRYYRELKDSAAFNDFSRFVKQIQSKPDSMLDEFEKLVLDYTLHPVNSFGFRSINFKNYTGKRKKVLLLGDSFTWGHSTKNITSSFADILLSHGYLVYNTGISGADPAQYLAVAKNLIPLLKPDYVVVNFFMGNDIQYYKRPIQPYMPFHYMTNSTNLISCPNGIYFDSPKQAYDFVYAHYTIPPDNAVNRFCAQFAITTLAWKALVKLNLATTVPNNYRSYWNKADRLKLSTPACNTELAQLKDFCATHATRFLLVPIPELRNGNLIGPSDVEGLFEGFTFYTPNVTTADYNNHDGHYNEAGHIKHTELIEHLISK